MRFENKEHADPVIAILAAGRSARMRGGDKLLEPVHGAPLLRRAAERCLACALPVVVTLPAGGARWEALDDLDVTRVAVLDAAEGMAASFRAIGRVVQAGPVLCLLADMPEIDETDLRRVLAAYRSDPERVHRGATMTGAPGQPVAFPARIVAQFATLKGDCGARSLLRDEDVGLVPLAEAHAVTDLDTPEDWADWRRRTGIGS